MHSIEEMMRAGCTTSRGVRYWEDQGMLGPVERSEGGRRRFTRDQMDKAKIIAAAQFGGWKLDEITQMLVEWGPEAYSAIMTRLSDQTRAAVRLGQQLPKPPRPAPVEDFDL